MSLTLLLLHPITWIIALVIIVVVVGTVVENWQAMRHWRIVNGFLVALAVVDHYTTAKSTSESTSQPGRHVVWYDNAWCGLDPFPVLTLVERDEIKDVV